MEVLVLLTSLMFTQQSMAGDKPSVHGMLMFGEKKIFFSHLPMFHSPHDYQAIFSVKLRAQAKALYLADKKIHPAEKIYTFVPEVMVLPEALLKTKVFKGEIYRGHFERGGVLLGKDVQVEVDDLIVFKKFEPQAVKPTQATYMLFGQPEEYWLAHNIAKKPDFDHIAAVNIPGDSSIQQPTILLSLKNLDNTKPLLDGNSFEAISGGQTIKLESLRTTYLEFDDLSM